jgi:hypothetical protein
MDSSNHGGISSSTSGEPSVEVKVEGVIMQKPKQRDFMKTVVIGSNGALIDEAVWRARISDEKGMIKGRELNKALKKENLATVQIFLKDQYQAAKEVFYKHVHTHIAARSTSVIDMAFEQAGVAKIKRVETILRNMLPLFKTQQDARVVRTFATIIKALNSSGVIGEINDREERKVARLAKTVSVVAGVGRGRGRRKASADAQTQEEQQAAA